jgi:hypothetical protein
MSNATFEANMQLCRDDFKPFLAGDAGWRHEGQLQQLGAIG